MTEALAVLAWDGGWSESCVEETQTIPPRPYPQVPSPCTDPGGGRGPSASAPQVPKVPSSHCSCNQL